MPSWQECSRQEGGSFASTGVDAVAAIVDQPADAPRGQSDVHAIGDIDPRAYAHIGPLELRGVRSYRSPRVFSQLGKRRGYYIAKVALVVQARRSVRLRVSGKRPDSVLLAYGSAEAGSNELLIDSCAATTRAR